MKWPAWSLVVVAACALAACSGPPIEAVKNDLPFAQVVTVTSKAESSLLVRRAVANNNDGNSSCDKPVGQTLAAGESTIVTFMGCGKVMELDVYTDQGVSSFSWK